jgi:preprotein translocase subunit SecE
MSRATRRQQKRAARGQQQAERKPSRPVMPRQTTKPGGQQAAAATTRRRGFLPSWITDVIAELRRVVWPSRQETINLTIVVIIVAVAMGIILGGFDLAFEWVVENILLAVRLI